MPSSSGFQVNEILTAANTNTYLLRPYNNAIINGAMNILQRGASQSGITTSNYYTADRWFTEMTVAGTWTQTVQALGSSDAPLQDGVRNSLKVTCNTANASLSAGSYKTMQQRIEGYNVQQFAKGTTNARNFALSFWVRSNRTGTYIAELYDFANNRTASASYTISASGTWQKVRIVYPSDVLGLIPNDNNNELMVCFWLVAGSTFSGGTLNTVWNNAVTANRAAGQVNLAGAVNNYWEMTGVQLEPNNVCTPYQWTQPAQELAMCQRYFYRINNTPQYEPIGVAGVNQAASNHWRTTTMMPVPMRKALVTSDMSWSSVIAYDGSGVVGVTAGAIVGHTATSTMVSIDWGSAGGLIAGRPVVILTNPNAGFFQLSAEL